MVQKSITPTEYRLLQELVREAILEQSLTGISCSPEEKNNVRSELQKLLQLDYSTPLPETTLEFLERQIRIEKFKDQTWGGKTLKKSFEDRKQEFDRVVYSLIRTKDEGVARELYFRLLEGEQNFSELAQQYSQGPEAKTGGKVGPIPLSLPHPQIAKLLRRSSAGQLHPPVKIDNWFVLIRLEKFVSGVLDAKLRQRLLDELYEEWLSKQIATAFQEANN